MNTAKTSVVVFAKRKLLLPQPLLYAEKPIQLIVPMALHDLGDVHVLHYLQMNIAVVAYEL